MVANSPRIGVGPGFDSQGCVTFFHKYCFPNLYWIHLVYYQVKWFGQYPNNLVIDYYNPGSGRAEMLLPWLLQRHHSWGNQPQKS